MRRSFRTAVPVTADPHPPHVRAAISGLIAEYRPVELTDIRVTAFEDEQFEVSAALPNGTRVLAEVYG